MSELQNFTCVACGREFLSTPEDVELAAGHMCIAADRGLTQREAIEEMGGREPGMSQRRNGIGSHTKPNKGTDVIWLTGQDVLANLGTFDLDPCAAPSPRPWPTALNHIELPQNGLEVKWHGRVWLNPPYDESLGDWMRKMAAHGIGIALTFARTETAIWQQWIWPFAEMICFFDGRLYFRFPDGSRAPGNAGGPSALIAYSPNDADHLWQSGIRGAYVKILKPRDVLKLRVEGDRSQGGSRG